MCIRDSNRIKEVKKSDGFPVYEGKTSIQVTVNREDAGCGKGKSAKLQIGCDGKGNRSRQEIHLGDLRLKNKEHIYEYAVYFDEDYKSLEKGAVVVIGQMHTDNKAKGCHNCCHFWAQDTKYKGENYYTWVSKSAYSSDPVIIGKIDDLKGKWTHLKFHVLWKLDETGRFVIYKNNEMIALVLAVAFSCSIAGLATPSGGARNVIAMGFLEEIYDIRISYVQWVILAAPITIALIPAVFLTLILVNKVSYRKIDYIQESGKSIDDRQILALSILVLTFGLFLTSGFNGLTLGTCAMIGGIMMHATGVLEWEDSRCLLYTSPSPRDATLARMPSSA